MHVMKYLYKSLPWVHETFAVIFFLLHWTSIVSQELRTANALMLTFPWAFYFFPWENTEFRAAKESVLLELAEALVRLIFKQWIQS